MQKKGYKIDLANVKELDVQYKAQVEEYMNTISRYVDIQGEIDRITNAVKVSASKQKALLSEYEKVKLTFKELGVEPNAVFLNSIKYLEMHVNNSSKIIDSANKSVQSLKDAVSLV